MSDVVVLETAVSQVPDLIKGEPISKHNFGKEKSHSEKWQANSQICRTLSHKFMVNRSVFLFIEL